MRPQLLLLLLLAAPLHALHVLLLLVVRVLLLPWPAALLQVEAALLPLFLFEGVLLLEFLLSLHPQQFWQVRVLQLWHAL